MLDLFIILINYIIKGLGAILNTIFSILPDSPFKMISNSVIAEYLPTLNFFIPVAEIISISQFWLSVIGIYYVYQIVLRWIKAIE